MIPILTFLVASTTFSSFKSLKASKDLSNASAIVFCSEKIFFVYKNGVSEYLTALFSNDAGLRPVMLGFAK